MEQGGHSHRTVQDDWGRAKRSRPMGMKMRGTESQDEGDVLLQKQER